MRIISFSDFHAHSNPIYNREKIIKLDDFVSLQNCLFVHDHLNDKLPTCFDDYFKQVKEIHSFGTRNSSSGCLFVNQSNSRKYGLNSITNKSINSWNFFTKKLKCNLKDISRFSLKQKITQYFLDSYQN